MFPNPPDLLRTLDNFPYLKKALPWIISGVVGALCCVPKVLRQLLDLLPHGAHSVRRVPIEWRLTAINGEIELLRAQQKLDRLRLQTVPSPQLIEAQQELPYRSATPLLEMPEKSVSLGS